VPPLSRTARRPRLPLRVTAPRGGQVWVLNEDGRLGEAGALRWGSRGRREGCFDEPRGLCLSLCGTQLLVADARNHRVVVLLVAGGEFVRAFGGHGAAAGRMDTPTAVAVAPDGRVAVAEEGNARVQLFAPHGRADGAGAVVLKTFRWEHEEALRSMYAPAPPARAAGRWVEADIGGTIEELGLPTAVCFTPRGELLVADAYFHRVLLFAPTAPPCARQKFGSGGGWGERRAGQEPGWFRRLRAEGRPLGRASHGPVGGGERDQLDCPGGVALGASGRLVVVDQGNRRVRLFI